MNHPSQFAQPFSWGIAAKAADAGPLLLASAAIIHDQMYDDRRAGQLVGECSRHAPVRVNLFRGQDLPERLGRRLRAGGSFQRAEGPDGNPVLAKPINHPLSAERLKNFAKGSKRHSSAPSSVSKQHGTEGVGSAQEILGVYQNVVDC